MKVAGESSRIIASTAVSTHEGGCVSHAEHPMAEEKRRGLARWLRPVHQAPGAAAGRPVTPADLARTFTHARTPTVADLLATLGHAREREPGRHTA